MGYLLSVLAYQTHARKHTSSGFPNKVVFKKICIVDRGFFDTICDVGYLLSSA